MNKEDRDAFLEFERLNYGGDGALGRCNRQFEEVFLAYKAACDRLRPQIADLTNQLACRQKDYESACNAMVERQDLYVKTKIELDESRAENRKLREQLVECQAREAQLRVALESIRFSTDKGLVLGNDKGRELLLSMRTAEQAIALPQDRTVLDAMLAQARHDVLMKAVNGVSKEVWYVPCSILLHMAKEQLK